MLHPPTKMGGNGSKSVEGVMERPKIEAEPKIPIVKIPELGYMYDLLTVLSANEPLIILRTDESEEYINEELAALAEYLDRPVYEFSISGGIVESGSAEGWMPPTENQGLMGAYLNGLLDQKGEIIKPGAIVVAPNIAHPYLFSDSGQKGGSFSDLADRLSTMQLLNKNSSEKRHLIITIPVNSELPEAIKKYEKKMPTPDKKRRLVLMRKLIEEYNEKAREKGRASILVEDIYLEAAAIRSMGMTCFQIERALTTGWFFDDVRYKDKKDRQLPTVIISERRDDVAEMLTFHPKEKATIVPVGIDDFDRVVGELLIKRGVKIGSPDLPRVLTLAGYPGTGKTSLVRALAAMAGYDVWEINSQYLFKDSYVGSLARRWAIIMEELKSLSKSQEGIIAFLDEAANAMAGASGGSCSNDSGYAKQGEGQVLKMLNEIRDGDNKNFGPIMMFLCFNTPDFSPQLLDRAVRKYCFSPFPASDHELLFKAFKVNMDPVRNRMEKSGQTLDDSAFDIDMVKRMTSNEFYQALGFEVGQQQSRLIFNGRTIENMLTNMLTEMSLEAPVGSNVRRITWEVLVRGARTISFDSVNRNDLSNYVRLASTYPDVRLGRKLNAKEIADRYGLTTNEVVALMNGGMPVVRGIS